MTAPLTIKNLSRNPIDPFSLLEEEDRARILLAARTDVSILLTGETGTGKGQIARAIAGRSSRAELVEVNCAALPDELLGSELFGHRKGAFTGAVADRKGLLMAAAGKTVFLDEIGEISPNMQRMLLRVVQRSNRTLKPLGSDREFPLPPLRFIFATNRSLEKEVREGRFREDLLRRIDVVTVTLPPLRSRPELIPGYTGRFLEELAALHNIPCQGIEKKALDDLMNRAWSGNVRELKNVLERALVTTPRGSGGVLIRLGDIGHGSGVLHRPRPVSLTDNEAVIVREALRRTKGNLGRAQRFLGLTSRSSLYTRLKRHGIDVSEFRRSGKKERKVEENS